MQFFLCWYKKYTIVFYTSKDELAINIVNMQILRVILV